MSCMMLTTKQIGILAGTLADLYNIGGQCGGGAYECYGLGLDTREFDRLLHDNNCIEHIWHCNALMLARLLYAENLAAYNGRYGETYGNRPKILVQPDEIKSIAKYSRYNGEISRHELMQWHFDLSVILDHYLYQIAEDATIHGAVYKALEAINNTIKESIINMDPRRKNPYDLLREIG